MLVSGKELANDLAHFEARSFLHHVFTLMMPSLLISLNPGLTARNPRSVSCMLGLVKSQKMRFMAMVPPI